MHNTRGVQNGIRQAFVYRGIQVMPTLDGGWLATIGARLYNEIAEDDICFAIDAAHLIIELQHERAAVQTAPCAKPKSAISGGGRRSSPSHGSRRYSTSQRGAA